jgi:hypothetical protein
MFIETVSKWAQEMEDLFDEFKYFPELEMMGAGSYIFFFYDLPKGQRLGIDNDLIVLYSANPDCEGLWSYSFADDLDNTNKVLISAAIFDLVRTSSPLYL